jgi:quinol-cytochrome oxidoreductase complex cytochrome b subunit
MIGTMALNFYNFFFKYPTPINIGTLWNWGVLSLVYLIIQIITGFFLSLHYTADGMTAFNSVEDLMRNISFG